MTMWCAKQANNFTIFDADGKTKIGSMKEESTNIGKLCFPSIARTMTSVLEIKGNRYEG